MESTGLEELQLEVIRALCLLPRESLVELCDYLIIAGAEFEHVTKKGRTALITLISNHIQREELEELEDKGMADLLYLQDKISELQIAGKAGTSKQVGEQQDGEEEKIQEGIEALQLQLASAWKQRENNKPDTKGIKSITHTRQSPQNVVHSPALHPWHKDFKIAGQIGSPCNSPSTCLDSYRQQGAMVHQDCNSQVSRCRIRPRGTGLLEAPDIEEELLSISKGLPHSPASPYQIVVKGENVLVVNRVELKIIARTVIGVAVASTFWLVVEQEDRDSLEVSR
ncbi:hypothetical protein DPEC_G00109220 [Dallia pectoralis]|uniref:Uncharacterized protein n=1 Tax=Dallia pectoralis TaxID=75939 RepID=A0ACC2GSA9_DALPE|nr:hypothetical protein DPEC_G00109220 [Dallia pectoralis]